jgi:methionyl-tRNA formyltransferase
MIFIGAHTPRSQAYAQCFARLGLAPRRTILYGPAGGQLPGQVASPPRTLFSSVPVLPDLSQPLEETCAGWDVVASEAADINAPELVALVRETSAHYAVFSGYGGQIVGVEMLSAGPRLIHVHPGKLPDFRGSTTIYYSWLDRGECWATAFLMSGDIDTGETLCSRRYAPPPGSLDVDYVYDSAIRADVLSALLEHYHQYGEMPREGSPEDGPGGVYYVIHPVLKHLALLSREG